MAYIRGVAYQKGARAERGRGFGQGAGRGEVGVARRLRTEAMGRYGAL
mgnify:CR=1 FL=1